MSCKEEEKIVPDRWVVGPTVEDGAGSETPQFKYGVLEWSQLN
jgi:hypothetical protein